MKRLLVALMVAGFLAAPALAKEKKHSEILGSFSWTDSRGSEARAIQGAFTWEFPLTHILSLGPAFVYDYVRVDAPASATTATPAVMSTHDTVPPVPPPTHTKVSGQSTEVWSAGARAVLHLNASHNGLYFAGEATVPQADAEGYVLTPEAGFQWHVGGAILRASYRHPFQQNGGDTVDLERDSLTVGFGGRW